MLNLRAGVASLIHWIRTERANSGAAHVADRRDLERQLKLCRSDLDILVGQIERDGVAVMPGYWTAEKCRAARQAFDRVLREQSASVQVSSAGSDQRLFGMEATDPVFADFHNDRFLRGFGELDGGLELYNFATLGGHIRAVPGNAGSGDGWHRDAHGYQFKAILYLSDTAPENGPFQYLLGSHKRWRVAVDTTLGNLPGAPQTRYADADIAHAAKSLRLDPRSFPAPAGTVLLVNTAGIHRGMPLQVGERYALTNYYYPPAQVDEGRIAHFSPLVPGTAERIRRELL